VLISANLDKFDWTWPAGTGAAILPSSSNGAPTTGSGVDGAAAKPEAATRARAEDDEKHPTSAARGR